MRAPRIATHSERDPSCSLSLSLSLSRARSLADSTACLCCRINSDAFENELSGSEEEELADGADKQKKEKVLSSLQPKNRDHGATPRPPQ
eukprot:COSAG03_NODE_1264_length_4442_cov_20.713332_4_plen_90_part_00